MKPLVMTTPGDTQVLIKRTFNAPVSLVWRAYSEPEFVKRWLTGPEGHTMPECEIDFRIGGTWRYVWLMPGEEHMVAFGTYKDIQPETLIVHSETFEMWPDNETHIETAFTPKGDMTEVAMTIHYDSIETRDMVLKTGMEQGLEASYSHLDAMLDQGL